MLYMLRENENQLKLLLPRITYCENIQILPKSQQNLKSGIMTNDVAPWPEGLVIVFHTKTVKMFLKSVKNRNVICWGVFV